MTDFVFPKPGSNLLKSGGDPNADLSPFEIVLKNNLESGNTNNLDPTLFTIIVKLSQQNPDESFLNMIGVDLIRTQNEQKKVKKDDLDYNNATKYIINEFRAYRECERILFYGIGGKPNHSEFVKKNIKYLWKKILRKSNVARSKILTQSIDEFNFLTMGDSNDSQHIFEQVNYHLNPDVVSSKGDFDKIEYDGSKKTEALKPGKGQLYVRKGITKNDNEDKILDNTMVVHAKNIGIVGPKNFQYASLEFESMIESISYIDYPFGIGLVSSLDDDEKIKKYYLKERINGGFKDSSIYLCESSVELEKIIRIRQLLAPYIKLSLVSKTFYQVVSLILQQTKIWSKCIEYMYGISIDAPSRFLYSDKILFRTSERKDTKYEPQFSVYGISFAKFEVLTKTDNIQMDTTLQHMNSYINNYASWLYFDNHLMLKSPFAFFNADDIFEHVQITKKRFSESTLEMSVEEFVEHERQDILKNVMEKAHDYAKLKLSQRHTGYVKSLSNCYKKLMDYYATIKIGSESSGTNLIKGYINRAAIIAEYITYVNFVELVYTHDRSNILEKTIKKIKTHFENVFYFIQIKKPLDLLPIQEKISHFPLSFDNFLRSHDQKKNPSSDPYEYLYQDYKQLCNVSMDLYGWNSKNADDRLKMSSQMFHDLRLRSLEDKEISSDGSLTNFWYRMRNLSFESKRNLLSTFMAFPILVNTIPPWIIEEFNLFKHFNLINRFYTKSKQSQDVDSPSTVTCTKPEIFVLSRVHSKLAVPTTYMTSFKKFIDLMQQEYNYEYPENTHVNGRDTVINSRIKYIPNWIVTTENANLIKKEKTWAHPYLPKTDYQVLYDMFYLKDGKQNVTKSSNNQKTKKVTKKQKGEEDEQQSGDTNKKDHEDGKDTITYKKLYHEHFLENDTLTCRWAHSEHFTVNTNIKMLLSENRIAFNTGIDLDAIRECDLHPDSDLVRLADVYSYCIDDDGKIKDMYKNFCQSYFGDFLIFLKNSYKFLKIIPDFKDQCFSPMFESIQNINSKFSKAVGFSYMDAMIEKMKEFDKNTEIVSGLEYRCGQMLNMFGEKGIHKLQHGVFSISENTPSNVKPGPKPMSEVMKAIKVTKKELSKTNADESFDDIEDDDEDVFSSSSSSSSSSSKNTKLFTKVNVPKPQKKVEVEKVVTKKRKNRDEDKLADNDDEMKEKPTKKAKKSTKNKDTNSDSEWDEWMLTDGNIADSPSQKKKKMVIVDDKSQIKSMPKSKNKSSLVPNTKKNQQPTVAPLAMPKRAINPFQ